MRALTVAMCMSLSLCLPGWAAETDLAGEAGGRHAVYIPKPMPMVRFVKDQASAAGTVLGTELAPDVRGTISMWNDAEGVAIWARAFGFPEPRELGPDRNAYVLWAVAPNGRAFNLGEMGYWVDYIGLETKTTLRDFGLMITAERNFAVQSPGSAVYAKVSFEDRRGDAVESYQAAADGLIRGVVFVNPKGSLGVRDMAVPRELSAARQAVESLQEGAGAGDDAEVAEAASLLRVAEEHYKENRPSRAIATARASIQAVEAVRLARGEREARILAQRRDEEKALKRIDEMVALASMRREVADLRDALGEAREDAGGSRGMTSVFFEPGKWKLDAEMRERLQELVELAAKKNREVIISGHADSSGPMEFNLRLSELRANAVKQFFVRAGIPEEAISIRAFGDFMPVDSNAKASGRQQNRRVDVEVVHAGK